MTFSPFFFLFSNSDSVRYKEAESFVYTVNGIPSNFFGTLARAVSSTMTSGSTPVVTDGDGLATVVVFALRSPPGSRTLQVSCGQANARFNVFIEYLVSSIRPLSPSPFSTLQEIGSPFTLQPSFQLCQAIPPSFMSRTNAFVGTCIPVPGQVVVAVAESFVSEVSLDGNKMAQLAGFVSTKSDFRGIATFRTLSVSGSSSQRVYFSFYAGGQSWSTWDGSPCSPGSSLRCTSYVQLSGGPSIHSMKILGMTSFLLSVPEGTSFPSVTVQAISASNTSIQNMVMYAQFSRIAGASCPKYTTPLRFGKKLLQGFAITNEMGQARFNLSSSISGFAGAYDVTFVPSITSSFPRTLKFPVISVLIATSVASVSASGPDYVVRTLLRSRDASQGAPFFGRPAPTTFEEMKSSNYATFFRLYFGEETAGVNNQVAQYLVFARDAGLNNVPGKLVELVSDPPNALDLFADTDCDGSTSSSLRPNLLPVTLVDTGSIRLCLKMAHPMPLADWIRPPQVLHGINTARFYFVVDGVRSSFFVTVFLTPPFPSATLTARLLLDNLKAFKKVMMLDFSDQISQTDDDIESFVLVLSIVCPILPPNSMQSVPYTPSSCAPSNQVPYADGFGSGGQRTTLYACIVKDNTLFVI